MKFDVDWHPHMTVNVLCRFQRIDQVAQMSSLPWNQQAVDQPGRAKVPACPNPGICAKSVLFMTVIGPKATTELCNHILVQT